MRAEYEIKESLMKQEQAEDVKKADVVPAGSPGESSVRAKLMKSPAYHGVLRRFNHDDRGQ